MTKSHANKLYKHHFYMLGMLAGISINTSMEEFRSRLFLRWQSAPVKKIINFYTSNYYFFV